MKTRRTTLLTVLLTAVHLCSSNTVMTISAVADPVILPDDTLRPSHLLICLLMPSSLVPDQDYESRWVTPSGAVVTAISGRYVVTDGTLPLDGVLHPATIFGIQYLSYTDAGSYICEARATNSTDDWVSASVHLQMNMELTTTVTEIQATVNDSSIEMSCEMSQFIRPDSFLVWEGPSGQRIDSDTGKYQITFKNGTPNAAANGSPILVPSRLSTLNISNPMPSDSGSYTCTVMGTNQSITIDVNVTGGDTDDTTAITTQGLTTGIDQHDATFSGMTMDQLDRLTIVLISTIIPALLALAVVAMLVAICVYKRIKNKQNQLQQEDHYSVVGPPALPQRNAINTPRTLKTNPTEYEYIEENQATNPAYGMNNIITVMIDQGNTTEQELRDSNLDCRHINTMQLSSNTAYSTNTSIAPEIECDVNGAYEQRDPNAECHDTILQSSNMAYGTNVAIAPEIDCEANSAYNLSS